MMWFDTNLAVGSASDATNMVECLASGVGVILNVANDLHIVKWHGVELAQVGLIDGPGNQAAAYAAAVLVIEAFHRSGKKVLVCCHGGKSRSVAVAIMYLNHKSKVSRSFEVWLESVCERTDTDMAPPHKAHIDAYRKMNWSALTKLGDA